MTVMGIKANKTCKFVAGLALLAWSLSSTGSHAQAPYLLPYTISSVIAGNGTAPSVGAPCSGVAGTKPVTEDIGGDGCPVSSPAVVLSKDSHDVGIDPLGNIYFLQYSSTSVLRKIDAHSGIVNVLAGTLGSNTTVCSGTTDYYGDTCAANDGKGNASGGYTYMEKQDRGMAVGKNGDVYFANYNNHLVQKISALDGKQYLVAGVVTQYPANKLNKAPTSGNYNGDGNTGPLANSGTVALKQPRGVAVDAVGDVFIADTGNQVIRAIYFGGAAAASIISATNSGITPVSGHIFTIAGVNPGGGASATAGFGGDGTLATSAGVLLNTPEDIEVDTNGNLFIADNSRVRVIYAGGTAVANLISLTNAGAVAHVGYIYTVAGGGATVYTAGNMYLATSIGLGTARKIALDARGNIYFADNTYNVIWFIDGTTGYIRNIAGTYNATTGTTCAAAVDTVGDNCPGTLGYLNNNSAMGVGVGPQGDVYISDSGNSRLRKVSLNSSFPVVAAGTPYSQTLVVHFAASDTPTATTPFTISGSSDFTIPVAPVCVLNPDSTTDCPVIVVFNPTHPGADTASLIVKSTLGQTVQFTLSGTGTASSVALDPGTATLISSGLSAPGGAAQDGAGNTYVADTGHNRVVRYTGTTATVIAGTGTSGFSGDGAAATAATLSAPKAVTVTPDGAVYIADTGNNRIRRIDPVTNIITTFGGGASTVCSALISNDSFNSGCLATSATFSAPAGIVSDSIGNLYVSDTGNNVIREISTNGYVFLIAGGGTVCTISGADFYGNGCPPLSAVFKSPTALAIDSTNNLYIADTGDNEVRKITTVINAATNLTSTLVSAVAGTGQAGGSGNGGLATTAQVNVPTGLSLDAAGNLYIADTGNHVVRVVAASGTINTVAGTLGSNGTGIVPGSASGILLNQPGAVVSTGIGKLYVLDSGNNRLLALDRGSVTLDFGRTNLGSSSPATSILETNTGTATASFGSSLFTQTGSTSLFTLSSFGTNGCSFSTQTLAPGSSCGLSALFTPVAIGAASATYTESSATTINSPVPFIKLSGTGAVLTTTTLTTAVTNPATGNPQYSIPFTVTATLHPAKCDTTAPDCTSSGTVTFFLDGTQVGLPVAVSNSSTTSSNIITASAIINGQSVGNHTIVAVFNGDTYYASSTAPTITVAVAQGATTTIATTTTPTSTQFSDLTLSASVASTTGNIPTGTIYFYAGSNQIGHSAVDPSTGAAILADKFTLSPTYDNNGKLISNKITKVPTSLGLPAGVYSLTAVYSGDSNYAASTSLATTLTITADPQGLAIGTCVTYDVLAGCTPATAGTAQGSTAKAKIYVVPSNTLNGSVSFACSGLPANTACTFGAVTSADDPNSTQPAGSTLIFAPVPGSAVPGTTVPGASVTLGALSTTPSPNLPPAVYVTFWTDVNPNVNSASNEVHSRATLAGLLGWPVLLCGFAGVFGFRKRIRNARLLAMLAFFALLTGGAMVMTGCTTQGSGGGITPTGTYTVTITATGPNGLVQTTTVPFTVGAGIAGQM